MSSKIDKENNSIITKIEKIFYKLIRKPKINPDKSTFSSCSYSNFLSQLEEEYYNIIPNSNPNSNPNIYPPKKIDFDIYLKCFIHEIKTPLMNITLGLELLGDNLLEEQKQTIKDIKKSVLFLEDILSKFQLIQDGNIVLNPFTPFSIISMMKSTETILYPYLRQSKIEYSFVSDLHIYEWNYGDIHNLQHILLNLIKNSVKYRNEKTNNKIIVKASLIENNDTTQIIEIIVQDNNNHILPDIKEKLFDVYNSTSGSGLGLFICKNILELHNGTISHNFIEPIGNEFVIKICLEKCIEPELQIKSNISSTNNLEQELKKTYSENIINKIGVLIIDDSKLNCKMFKQVLYQIIPNICVYTENNVINGIQKLIENINKIHIIFIDKNLPNINGLVFTKIIKMLNYNKLIFGLTGDTDNNDFIESGANYIFIKPINKIKIMQLSSFLKNYGIEVQENKKIELINNSLEWI